MRYCQTCGGKLNQQGQCPTCSTDVKEPEKKKNRKLLLLIILALVAVAVLAICTLIIGMRIGTERSNTDADDSKTEEISNKAKSAAVVSGHELTAADINYWLMDTYSEIQTNMQSDPASGFDTAKSLKEQKCTVAGYETKTWYDYALDQALQSAAVSYAIYDEAVNSGFTLSESGNASIESQLQMLDMSASMYGFSDGDAYLAAAYGKGCKVDSYKEYLTVTTMAQEYQSSVLNSFSFTNEELQTCYNALAEENDLVRFRVFHAETEADAKAMMKASINEEAFLEEVMTRVPAEEQAAFDPNYETISLITKAYAAEYYGEWFNEEHSYGDVTVISHDHDHHVVFFLGTISRDTVLTDIRHIMVRAEAADGNFPTDEAYADAYPKAQSILNEYLAGEQTEAAFAALATSYTEDTGSTETGGLYEALDPSQMVTTFANWAYEDHIPGDTGIIKTEYGYHIMYFVGNSDTTYGNIVAQPYLANEEANEWITNIDSTASYTLNSTKNLTEF